MAWINVCECQLSHCLGKCLHMYIKCTDANSATCIMKNTPVDVSVCGCMQMSIGFD